MASTAVGAPLLKCQRSLTFWLIDCQSTPRRSAKSAGYAPERWVFRGASPLPRYCLAWPSNTRRCSSPWRPT